MADPLRAEGAAAAGGAAGGEYAIRLQGLEKSWELHVRSGTSVRELKEQLAGASGTPVAQQRLIYQGAAAVARRGIRARQRAKTKPRGHVARRFARA